MPQGLTGEGLKAQVKEAQTALKNLAFQLRILRDMQQLVQDGVFQPDFGSLQGQPEFEILQHVDLPRLIADSSDFYNQNSQQLELLARFQP